ncbi:hypothetical protein EUX98_g8814 [Antrodiella citrinella]|uniref:Uncharacterized protein n=1 Tax=Antrodiella citrinella TaxID=2447956 RepID=A0A4S4M2H0_9APHY|nr:hypothetical protein EUX98_g8814 [Antrodiella citrinella]
MSQDLQAEGQRLQDLSNQLLAAKDNDIASLKEIGEKRFKEKLEEIATLQDHNEHLLERLKEEEEGRRIDARSSTERETSTVGCLFSTGCTACLTSAFQKGEALREIGALKSSMDAEQQKSSKLEKTLQQASEEIEELRGENEVLAKENEKLLEEVKRCQDRLDGYDEEFEVQAGLLVQTQSDLDTAEARVKEDARERIILVDEVKGAWAKLSEAQEKLKAQESDYTLILDRRDASLKEANSTLADVREKLAHAERDYKLEAEMNARIEERMHALNVAIERKEDQLENALDNCKRYQKSIKGLGTELSQKVSEANVAQDLISSLQDEVNKLKEDALQKDDESKAVSNALAKAQAQADVEGARLTASKEQDNKEEYEKLIERLRDSLDSVSAELDLSTATCNAAQAAQSHLAKELAKDAAKIDDLQTRLVASQSESREHQDQANCFRHQSKTFSKALTKSLEEAAALKRLETTGTQV